MGTPKSAELRPKRRYPSETNTYVSLGAIGPYLARSRYISAWTVRCRETLSRNRTVVLQSEFPFLAILKAIRATVAAFHALRRPACHVPRSEVRGKELQIAWPSEALHRLPAHTSEGKTEKGHATKQRRTNLIG